MLIKMVKKSDFLNVDETVVKGCTRFDACFMFFQKFT